MGRHILIINRFDKALGCRYDRYIDHSVDRVAYITTATGKEAVVPESAETMATVDDLGDWSAVQRSAREIVARFGPVDHVVALYENDLDTAAALRELLNVPGAGPEEVRRVRDKVTMKTLVADAGLRVPRFTVADSSDAIRRFVASCGFPVVLKPRRGADSQGIILVESPAALEEVLSAPLPDYECEEFITGVMYQVDGVAQDGTVRVLRSSRLLNTCLEYALGGPFGSVANDDADLERRLFGYAQRVLEALGMKTGAFHLEVFHTGPVADAVARPAGASNGSDEYDDLVFLELGARAGGAEIPHLWRDIYGLDLHELSIRLHLGEAPAMHHIDVAGEVGGYLLMPEPPTRPCRVLHVESLIDRIPEIYAELLPPPGAILDGTGGCKETGGRYRFRARSSREIEQAIRTVVAEYKLDWEPLLAADGHTARSHVRPIGRAQSVKRP